MEDETQTNPGSGERHLGATPSSAGSGAAPASRAGTQVDRSGGRDLSGRILGGYQLVRKIAEGGMGEVYEATQTKLSRRVALKILSEKYASRPDFLHRFEREAKTAGALNHPNVVQVHDFGEDGGMHYLVMEYVEGVDLSEHVQKRGKLPVTEALVLIEQAAQALRAARAKSIIHRDIKPSNLLLTREGTLKVSDMGLAKMITDDTDVTVTGVGLGSPHFVAPEQAMDAAHVDHRADIYALGITLLFILTGKRPYEGATPFSVVLAHANKSLPSGSDLGTELPSAVEGLIKRMSAKQPEGRYQDYDALLADIGRVKAGSAPAFRPKLTGRLASVGGIQGLLVAGFAVALVAVFGSIYMSKRPAAGQQAAVKAVAAPGRSSPDSAPPNDWGPPREKGFRQPNGPGAPEFERGPGPPGGPPPLNQGPERSGPPRAMPMGPPPGRPNFSPIEDGPVATMLTKADEFAAAHPTDYITVINAFRQVRDKNGLTDAQRTALGTKIDDVVRRHQSAVVTTIAAYEKKMRDLIRAGRNRDAYDVWRDFPSSLRTREVDEEILQKVEAALPRDFRPGP